MTDIKRRGFLKMLGIGAAAVPLLGFRPSTEIKEIVEELDADLLGVSAEEFDAELLATSEPYASCVASTVEPLSVGRQYVAGLRTARAEIIVKEVGGGPKTECWIDRINSGEPVTLALYIGPMSYVVGDWIATGLNVNPGELTTVDLISAGSITRTDRAPASVEEVGGVRCLSLEQEQIDITAYGDMSVTRSTYVPRWDDDE